MSDGSGTNKHPKPRDQGPTWLQTLALMAITGVIVFAFTREMYLGDADRELVAGSDIAVPSAASPDQLVVNTAMLESLLSIDSQQKDPATMSLLANQYFDNRRYEEAADLYGQLSVLDPANVDLLNNLGLTLQYINRSEEALEVLTRGSKLDPNNQRIWLTLGFVNQSIGNTDAARSALQTAAHIDPDSDVGISASKMLSEL
ncbi:MAG: tetratricopeptide repeat protein [Gammaproteobacteria bacterium]|nr:tetratricopeptide repeat protein [Gammaproteobacteria bacterium]